MKILMIGAGIIGSIYGWALAQAGQQVTHLVRPGKAGRFADGMAIDLLDSRKGHRKHFVGCYRLHLTEEVTPADGFNLVIVPTKPYQVEEALRAVVSQTGWADYLLLTQNWEGTKAIDAILPRSRYFYGDAQAGGTFKDDVLVAALYPSIHLGAVQGLGTEGVQLETAFAGAGITPVWHSDILQYLWVQYAINAGLWPPLVRAGGLEALLRDRRLGDLSLQAVRECLQVVRARGVDLQRYPDSRMYDQTSAVGRQFAGLMLRLMFRFNASVNRMSAHALGDPREIGSAYDNLLKTGDRLGVAMPVMRSFADDMRRFTSQSAEQPAEAANA